MHKMIKRILLDDYARDAKIQRPIYEQRSVGMTGMTTGYLDPVASCWVSLQVGQDVMNSH